jgi:sigma-54 dependent transcriptional regulator, acetoin dehydrogenase operon transcriptional activator AcoR
MITSLSLHSSSNQNKLRKSWENFISNGTFNDPISSIIGQSWQESKKSNIDPFISKLPINQNLYEQFINTNQSFVNAVDETIQQLEIYLNSSSSIIQFLNSEAILLKKYGDPNVIERMASMNNVPGAMLDLNTSGTNAISLALKHKKPVFITGAEHFCNIFHDISCFAVPIINKRNNEVIGILDITGTETLKPHAFGLIQSSLTAIEGKLEKYSLRQDSALLDYYVSQFSYGANPIICINKNETITRCSESAFSILGGPPQDWIGKSVHSLKLTSLITHMHLKEDEVEFYDTLGNETDVRVVLNYIRYEEEFIGWLMKIYPLKRNVEQVHLEKFLSFDVLIGSSNIFQKVVHKAKKVATSNANILILGETGTGKEMFARSIHNCSERNKGPFVPINCGAIPKELIGSELFGYEEGAFSGARKGGQKGKFEIANGGTIFLDEIGELPLEHQVYLLRVLQEREFYPLGGKKAIPLNVRIIAATNVDLIESVKNNQFREDLFYRLNVVNLRLPSLRERGKEDVILLIKHFVVYYNRQERRKINLSKKAIDMLASFPWRGNVRELENTVYRLIILTDQKEVSLEKVYETLDDIGYPMVHEVETKCYSLTLDEVERAEIIRALNNNGGNMSKGAEELKISRTTLYRKMQKYQISTDKILK